MAIFATTRRLSDGLIAGAQSSPNPPDEAAMIANAVSAFGGAPEDWQMVTLTQQQYDAVIAALPGRSFLVNDTVISATPPQLTSEVTGAGEVTVTCDVGDAGYNGAISWECTSPDGVSFKTSGTASAGVEAWAIGTGQIGSYTVRVDVELFGAAEITFSEAD